MNNFAYGSNMWTARIRERVPSSVAIGIGYVTGYQFKFNKRSNTRSSKANAYQTNIPDSKVWGVIWSIDSTEKQVLDRAEGLGFGYDEIEVDVALSNGSTERASMYIASTNAIDNALFPFRWYKDFVVKGAMQHQLPEEYVQAIAALPAMEDPDVNRQRTNDEILTRDA